MDQGIDVATQQGACVKAELAGKLIDIGSEGHIEEAAQKGIEIYESEREHLKKFVSEASIEYNLGNGKGALFTIGRTKNSFEFKPETIRLLLDEKNHFWKAHKLFGLKHDYLRSQLLVNLANALSYSGRVVEALQYRDMVLKEAPRFPQANAGRAHDLLWLHQLSDTYSTEQLRQAMIGFAVASESPDLPSWLTEQWKDKSAWLSEVLEDHGYSKDHTSHDLKETEREAKTHSRYRQFCLENHLTLAEHSLYCNCIGARRDDLSIPKTTKSIGGDFVPRMEHVLNRLKSEYALARLLYYRAVSQDINNWQTYDEEVTYTELYEDEAIGTGPEMLRTSFRLCFGVLDKIGRAVCDLFNLADPTEPIYFESFWRPRGSNLSEKQKQRWSKVNSIENFPLLALYSQATDLNSHGGEWGIFKTWRNDLEHEMLILTQSAREPIDIYGTLGGTTSTKRVQHEEFKEKTLHLLQLTRSAIFNFVFCVRHEGEKERGPNEIPIPLNHKYS